MKFSRTFQHAAVADFFRDLKIYYTIAVWLVQWNDDPQRVRATGSVW